MMCPSCGAKVSINSVDVVEESADEQGLEVGFTCASCKEYFYTAVYPHDFHILVDIEE